MFVSTLQQRDSIVQQNTHPIFRICRRRGRKRWRNSSSSSAVFDEHAICRVVSTPEPDPPTATASTGMPCTLGVSIRYIPLLPLAGDSRCHLPLFVMPFQQSGFLTHPTPVEEGNLLPDVSRRGQSLSVPSRTLSSVSSRLTSSTPQPQPLNNKLPSSLRFKPLWVSRFCATAQHTPERVQHAPSSLLTSSSAQFVPPQRALSVRFC